MKTLTAMVVGALVGAAVVVGVFQWKQAPKTRLTDGQPRTRLTDGQTTWVYSCSDFRSHCSDWDDIRFLVKFLKPALDIAREKGDKVAMISIFSSAQRNDFGGLERKIVDLLCKWGIRTLSGVSLDEN